MTRLPATLLFFIPVLLVASDGKRSAPETTVQVPSCEGPTRRAAIPPDEGPPDLGEHEPRGFEPIACLTFPDRGRSGSRGALLSARGDAAAVDPVAPGWKIIDDPRFQVVRDSTAHGADRWVARALFPAGWKGGSAPVWAAHTFAGREYSRIFVSFRVKVSENWQGHHVGDKLLYAWIHEQPVAFPIYTGGVGPLSTELRIQGVPAGARNLLPNLGSSSITRGKWHHWEILLRANTPGLADGEIHWWIDGRKIGEYADVEVSGIGQATTWERVVWRPVWGGQGGVIEEDQYMWMDELYVSGAP